jgi:hypothetical protein
MASRPAFDRWFWLGLLLAAAVVVPRSILTLSWHCESTDDEYHLTRGLMFWCHSIPPELDLNDPPLGEAIVAAPLLLIPKSHPVPESEIHGRILSPETVLKIIAAWKALLFLPLAMVVFAWCRTLYGLRAGWLAWAMLLVEPNFAAHIPVAALDVLGVEAIVIACFLAWRYFQKPTGPRLIAAAFATAAAMLIKHTAIILPAVIVAMAIFWWILRPLRLHEPITRALPHRLQHGALAIGLVLLWMWMLLGFDISRSAQPAWPAGATPPGHALLQRRLPGGLYIRSVMFGMSHNAVGHQNYLFGRRKAAGWWYYFPVLATYKIPLGIGLVLLLGAASLFHRRGSFEGLGLLLPLLAWTALAMAQNVDIGFRHFLPAYVFMLMLASRCVQPAAIGWSIAAWTGVAAAAIRGASFHPDYISYINFPRDRAYLQISDSNIDWGQGIPQARRWLLAHPPKNGQPVSIETFGGHTAKPRLIAYYMRSTAAVPANGILPARGLLIISKVQVAGPYDRNKSFVPLRTLDPIAEIGHSMLVYDLDALRAAGKLPPARHPRRAPRQHSATDKH